VSRLETENAKLTKQVDERDRELSGVLRKEKEVSSALSKAEQEAKVLDKKYLKSKKYVKQLEELLIEKEAKIKQMKLEKKNDDLCSQIESQIGNGLNELAVFEDSYRPQTKNMISSHQDEDIEPEGYGNEEF
jgi:predicted RNase H-like nuclease (RuvC/YqgF family)